MWLLAELGHFDGEDLAFKGGTSLRKCRLGGAGRFSTDLDFVAPSDDTVLEVCESMDGVSVVLPSRATAPPRLSPNPRILKLSKVGEECRRLPVRCGDGVAVDARAVRGR